jgi:hypothetical protein
MIMLEQLRFAAVALIAAAIIVLTPAAGWAFSQQTLVPNGNYDFNYGPPDDKAKLGESTTKPDSNSPGFHFSIESGQSGPSGFHSFGESNNPKFPDYFPRPLGSGN